MRDLTLVSYKIIRVDDNQFDKHFCFFPYVCLCLPKRSFLRCTQVLKLECAMESPPSYGNFLSYKQAEGE